MAVERIKWNMKGFRDLRRSREVMSDLIKRGKVIADSAGAGYEVTPYTGKNRGRVSVITASPEAVLDNATNNTLVRSIGATPGDVTNITEANDGKMWYLTNSGKRVRASPAQILNWTKNV